MKKRISSIPAGQRFGQLVTTGMIARDRNNCIKWEMLCDCGNEGYFYRSAIVSYKRHCDDNVHYENGRKPPVIWAVRRWRWLKIAISRDLEDAALAGPNYEFY